MRVWIEITVFSAPLVGADVSPSYEGVDWNAKDVFSGFDFNCFTLLWGCGLKLTLLACSFRLLQFHPLMRVWIEIKKLVLYLRCPAPFHPLMRVWIEIRVLWLMQVRQNVSPSYEGVDWNKWFSLHHKGRKRFHPLMRVWIEMSPCFKFNLFISSFTLLWGCGLKWLVLLG